MTATLSRRTRAAIVIGLGTWGLFFAPQALVRLWLWPMELARVFVNLAVSR